MADFVGISSVADRTLFTHRGPIVKRPLPLLVGSDLRISSYAEVEIASGNFSQDDVGRLLSISGSPGGRNDGTFPVSAVLTSKRLRLEGASFSVLDEAATVAAVVALANDIRRQYGLHRSRKVVVAGATVGVHGTDDGTNVVTASGAADLASAILLANDLLVKYGAHAQDVSGSPGVHVEADDQDLVGLGPSSTMSQVIGLLNELRRRYEAHRQNHFVHQHVDLVDRVEAQPVRATINVYPGPLTGPFPWTVLDPRHGQPADSPYDVDVTVNGSPATVDAVFGLIGAVVLSSKPVWSDTVSVSYDHISNPPSRFMRLNSPEFVLNQFGNTAMAGFPKHRYRSSSHLLSSLDGPDLSAPFRPFRRGWKYKALERASTASLNDPSTLLLNVPTNKLSFPVLAERASEETVRYDPFTLPQSAPDPWAQEGQGTLVLAPGGSALTIVDSSTQTGVDSRPPFFTHALDLDVESVVSAAFRARMSADPAVFVPDGVFSGVSLGVTNGARVAVVGLILTEATGLSSALIMANDVMAQLDGHVVNVGSHFPDDPGDAVDLVRAVDLPSLLVLVNSLRASYSAHVSKGGGPGLVHLSPDSANVLSSPAAEDLPGAVVLVNEIRARLNAHGSQPGVHFTSDLSHQVSLVRQVGLLTGRGFPEFAASWNAFASDWTEYRTYRVSREADGSVGVFVSGDLSPSATAALGDLPAASDVDARFDLVQQAFFGTIGRESKSSSDWQFVRVNVQPVDADLIENNKQLDYDASSVPELADPPWITYGQGGTERVLAPGVLLLDSTSSASAADVPQLGLVSGAYRGFLRYEPILSVDNALVAEFRMGADYWTSSVSDRAFGLFMADPDFSVQLAFLQATPVPAVTTGTVADPFVLVNGDALVVQVGDGPPSTVSFVIPPGTNTAASVASRINSVLGFPFASSASGHVRLASPGVGASAAFSVLSGSALAKLGLSPGKYFGSDSSPEPKMSWFGANLPELDDPRWVRSGGQAAGLLGRVLRTSDASASDYVAWTLEDPLVTNQVLGASDWKLDVRLSVLSFVSGPSVPASVPYLNLDFAGALVSVDEGPSGKNVELHLSVDPSSGGQYLNLLSYDSSTGSLLVVSQYAFSWNDGAVHTFNVYTAKSVDSLMVLADGVVLSPSAGPLPTYSGLRPGVSGPSMSFGSGGEPVVGADMRVCQSVADWYSVAAFGDSKIADPEAPSRRYVGVYAGGPRDVLSSYYLHQVDWAPLHTYRIMRDPSAGLQVYLDGSPTPAISVPYDVLTLPPAASSFLSAAVRGRPFVAFGAFSPSEISRTRWDFVRYSVGKVTLTDLLVPPHQVLNQANAMASPDHLRTRVPHRHQGFTVYSGGTPIDEFMSDGDVSAFTVLGEGTPPVPATQNLETRHGLVKVGTPFDGVAAVDAASFPGLATDLVDDDVNVADGPVVLLPEAVSLLVALVNALRAAYESHRVFPGVHALDDVFDPISASPASGLTSAISLANDLKAKINLHFVRPGVHVPNDAADAIGAPDAVDISSASVLADAVLIAYSEHIGYGAYHLSPDLVDNVTAPGASDLLSAATLAATLADALSDHGLSTAFHESPDWANSKFVQPALPGVGKAGVIGLSVLTTSASLDPGQLVSFVDGPNSGQSRMVVSKSSAAEYLVAPGFLFNDPGHSRYVRLGRSSLTSAIATSAVGYSLVEVDGEAVPSAVGDQVMFLSGPNYGELRTVSAVAGPGVLHVSPVLPVSDVGSWTMAYVAGPAAPGVDPLYVVALSNLLGSRFGSHRTAPGVHRTDDVLDLVTAPAAVVLADSFPLLNDLKDRLNLHLTGFRFHLIEDVVNVVSALPAVDPLAAAIASLNSVREAFLDHVVQYRVHLQDDDSNSLLPVPAAGLDSAMLLANALKSRLNRHLSAVVHEVVGPLVQRVHSMDDTVNMVSAPDATDLASLCDLAADLLDSYNSHRVQPGVHGSTLLVRLEAPTGVLYEGLRFWTSDSGDALARMSPFSDDDGPSALGPLFQTRDASYSYAGSRLPEDDILYRTVGLANSLKALFNSHRTRSGVHVLDDTVNVVSAPDATGLPSLFVLLSEMKEKFTLHLSQAGVHVGDDVRDRIVASDPSALAMAVALVTELRMKYGLHRVSDVYHLVPDAVDFVVAPDPQPYGDGWVLVSSLPDAASVTLVTVPESALRVETLSPGTTLTYVMKTGLPDSRSLGLLFTVRLRINSFAYSPDVDTGIYLGFLSNAGPGVAAAIGFDALNNIPYVKIQDVNANVAMARIPFDWADGQFHTYRITRDVLTDSLTLSVED